MTEKKYKNTKDIKIEKLPLKIQDNDEYILRYPYLYNECVDNLNYGL